MLTTRPGVFGTILLAVVVSAGCDRGKQDTAATEAAPAPVQAQVAIDETFDPCKLLTVEEVRRAVPQATAGKRDSNDEGYGIWTCTWGTPQGGLTLQVHNAGPNSVESEIRGLSFGLVDMRSPVAGTAVRLEPVRGMGDGAILLVEKTDPKRGIKAGNAILVSQRGARVAVLRAPELATGERAASMELLEALGSAVTKRL